MYLKNRQYELVIISSGIIVGRFAFHYSADNKLSLYMYNHTMHRIGIIGVVLIF